MLPKLHFYRIQAVSEYWFRSYLTKRRQKVKVKSPNTIKNFFSDLCTLKHRVPQGSILAPYCS